jgi:hypothetical protein
MALPAAYVLSVCCSPNLFSMVANWWLDFVCMLTADKNRHILDLVEAKTQLQEEVRSHTVTLYIFCYDANPNKNGFAR